MSKRCKSVPQEEGPVLKYFTVDKAEGVIICNVEVHRDNGDTESLCGERLKMTASELINDRGTRTYNLRRHLQRVHPEIGKVDF